MFKYCRQWLEMVRVHLNNEDGQGMVEYALIIGLIAIAVIGAIGILSGGIKELFTKIGTRLTNDAGTI